MKVARAQWARNATGKSAVPVAPQPGDIRYYFQAAPKPESKATVKNEEVKNETGGARTIPMEELKKILNPSSGSADLNGNPVISMLMAQVSALQQQMG